MNRDRTIGAVKESTPRIGSIILSERPINVVHVEVGGSYGGSLRALEIYLRYSDPNRFTHDVLFYHPTPGAEKLESVARKVVTLYKATSEQSKPLSEVVRATPWTHLRSTTVGRLLIELRNWIGVLTTLGTARQIANILRREQYDVVHVNNTFTYQVPSLLAAKRVGIPVLAHVRNPVPRGGFNRTILHWTDSLVTVSPILEGELRSWGLDIPFHTCHDGVEPPVANTSAAAAWRASLLPTGGILVGSVGRLDEQKGYHDLIRAARIVIDARPDVRFAVAGEGPLRRSLETLIAKLDLAEHFQLCGFRTDIANFLGALDLFVCSSHWEGGPLVVIEAMALAKPVVSTNVGFTPNIVLAGVTGELVSVGDPNALASAILEALHCYRKAAYNPRKAIEIAAEWSDPVASAKITDNLLSELAGY